jgi:hypothetical protein
LKVKEEIEKARALAEEGKTKEARSSLMGIWRKYKGLPEAEMAKEMADAMK